ncbi:MULTISPECIES: ion transporter [Flavobacterium]|uniref:ion transporter n=1 Tax=Flavobacterium TaxID=237 RepID=UPI001FCBF414|nr:MULTISPECIES: ion transporter [Flavobacterium]UOK42070.1 ion transporter [Flavobacterium enshiense]
MKKIKSEYELLRQRIYIIVYGSNTVAGRLFDIVLLSVILLSVLLVMLESVEQLDKKYHSTIIVLEWIITVCFTLEYLLRIICNKKPLTYIFSFYGIVDFISILPMYLSFFIPGSRILSVIRALRLLRLFGILNLVHFTGQESQLKLAIKASRSKIIVFVYFVLIVSILLGAIMYVVEGKESGFTSIPTSIYWCIVTLTTVGYGDIAPVTIPGQIIASCIMILGYGIIAVPTGIVTAEFAAAKRNQKPIQNAKKCPSCSTIITIEDAKYCFHCGEKLDNE